MICMSCPQPAEEADRPACSPSLIASAGALIHRAWRSYWDWRARQVTVLLLSSLDSRTLHDIGISPSEIESVVWSSCDRCRRYDAS
jgi:uncharacterized protein YjiS (DUF1127 family)